MKPQSTAAMSLEQQMGQFALIVGSMHNVRTNAPVPYWPVEVSQYQLVVLTDANLQGNDGIIFRSEVKEARLKIKAIITNYKDSEYSLITLIATNLRSNLEQLLRDVPELRRWNAHRVANEPIRLPIGKIHVRSARFETKRPIEVQAATFGTRNRYILETENVSKSGLLLGETGEHTPPFTDNTIVEIIIDPATKYFAEPVHCLAKIVRLDKDQQGVRNRYALQLIELDDSTSGIWFDYVEELEREMSIHETGPSQNQ